MHQRVPNRQQVRRQDHQTPSRHPIASEFSSTGIQAKAHLYPRSLCTADVFSSLFATYDVSRSGTAIVKCLNRSSHELSLNNFFALYECGFACRTTPTSLPRAALRSLLADGWRAMAGNETNETACLPACTDSTDRRRVLLSN